MIVLVRRGLPLLMILSIAGCSTGEHAQARPRQSLIVPSVPDSPTTRTRPARPGDVCGKVTTVTGATARVRVVRGRTTCAEAMRIFQKYNDPMTPAEGTAGLAVIGRWTCETRGTTTTCVSKAATIQSRA